MSRKQQSFDNDRVYTDGKSWHLHVLCELVENLSWHEKKGWTLCGGKTESLNKYFYI